MIEALSVLFGSGGAVQLGSVTLQDFEVPASITLSSRHVIKEHRLPGGLVQIQRLGRFWSPITWSGTILSAGAVGRSLLFQEMSRTSDEQILSWLGRSFAVVVENFTVHDQKQNLVRYTISCRVVRDNAASRSSPAKSLAGSLTDDLSNALGITLPSSTDILSGLSQVQSTLTTVAGVLPFGGAAFNQALGALSSAQGVVTAGAAVADGQIGLLQGVAGAAGAVFPRVGAVTAAGNVLTAVSAAGRLATLAPVGALLSRMTTNLENFPQ